MKKSLVLKSRIIQSLMVIVFFLIFPVTLYGCGSISPKPTVAPTATPTPTSTPTPTKPVDPDTFQMTSLPAVYINTRGQRISEGDAYTEIDITFLSPDGSYTQEDLVAGIRLRGNASRNFAKKSYKIKLNEKKNLYGLAQGKEKKWVLIANHCDQSLLRNYAALTLHNELLGSSWAPGCMSVELFIDGHYKGVYMLAEQIEVSKDRININDKDTDALDIGYLMEFSSYKEGPYFTINGCPYSIKSDLSEDESLRQEQLAFIKDYLLECRQALITGDEEKASELIDLDSLVTAYLVEEFSKNQDSQWDSFYYYKDAGGKLTVGPLWDFDLAFGNDQRATSGTSNSYKELYVANGRGSVNGDGDKTIFIVAMQNEWFRKRVRDAWNENLTAFSQLSVKTLQYAQSAQECYERNFVRWRIFGQRINQEPSEIMRLTTYNEHLYYLTGWMNNRYNWLNNTFNSDAFINGDLIKKVNTTR